MGIAFTQKEVKVNVQDKPTRERKPRYTNADLPFEDSAADLKHWQLNVVSAVLDWTATLEDPFAAISHEGFRPNVEEIWKTHFPAYEITEAVYEVVSNIPSFICFSLTS
jgi:hypothetical protein